MLLGVVATGLWSCSSEEGVSEPEASGRTVHITVNVSRDASAATRTEMSEDENKPGDLACVWTEGDKLLVTDKNGNKKGVLSLSSSSVGNEKGTFTGDLENVTDGEHDFNLIYLGKAWSASGALAADAGLKTEGGKTTFTADYSTQGGDIKSLTDKDILAKETKVNVKSGSDYALVEETVTLERKISFAKFSLSSIQNYKNDLNYADLGYVAVSGEGLMKSLTLNVADLSVSATAGDVLVEKQIKDNDYDFYMVLLPGETEPKPIQVSVSNGDDVYTGTYTRTTGNLIGEGKYYRKDKGDGTYAGLPLDNWSTKKNPGKIENWAGSDLNLDPDAEYVKEITLVSKADGWTLNVSTLGAESYGGFGYYINYKQNGAINGILTSKKNNRIDSSAIFYQWGRWMGFPYCASWIYLIPGGDGEIYSPYGKIYNEMLPLGVNYLQTKIGYSWWNSGSGAYVSAYMGANDSWTKERAINCSICYGLGNSLSGHLDYVFNNEDCTWEERGYNPAPNKYAIPTAEQLEALIPEGGSVASNEVQFKIINGVRYAMKWKKVDANVGGSSKLPAVEISSFKTNDASVSSNDTRFNSENPIRLVTFGYLDNNGDLQVEGTYGYYWSCESGKNELTLSGGTKLTGLGGKALYVNINGNTVKMGMKVLPRTFAANVYLFKDEQRKSDSLKPWFPLTGVGTPHW